MFRRRRWHCTPVLLPGKSCGRKSLVGCSPWGHWGSDTTERLHFHFSLSCIGDGNGNPLQCSCQENPRDGGAWWAAVYGIARSLTRLKWLSSSSSMSCLHSCLVPLFCLVASKQVCCHYAVSFVGDANLTPELGWSPGEGNGNPLQYSSLGNPMETGLGPVGPQFTESRRVRHDLATKQQKQLAHNRAR